LTFQKTQLSLPVSFFVISFDVKKSQNCINTELSQEKDLAPNSASLWYGTVKENWYTSKVGA